MTFVAVDHLVVAAASLTDGVAWCEATLGVTPGPGGKHPQFGTHNRLLKIASDAYPQSYLEIIAIDPEAPKPTRPRWYGLDEIDLSTGPRLIHWVGRSPMLDMHRWGLITVGEPPGDPVAASRETPQGLLQWQITVTADGRPRCAGALPTLIQWQGVHPTDAMPASDITLKSLTIRRVPQRARDVLRLRGVTARDDDGPSLQAVLSTPRGDVTLNTTP
jgi:hypothetical protein